MRDNPFIFADAPKYAKRWESASGRRGAVGCLLVVLIEGKVLKFAGSSAFHRVSNLPHQTIRRDLIEAFLPALRRLVVSELLAREDASPMNFL